jgi:tungstate transport system ATP-binding protein
MPDAVAISARCPWPRALPDGDCLGETRGLIYQAGESRLIDGIDLMIPRGSITVMMGPNGAGKSMLLRLLHGLLTPTAGQVLWSGLPLGAELRRQQAMVFQRPVLLRRSVAANIRFVLKLRGRPDSTRVDEILSEVGLDAHARQPARLLSGGEQQRLNLARALASDPRVLFLDEPTANLDPASTAAIEAIVKKAHGRGTKIIFVTHDLGQARRLADDVVFLDSGRLAEQASARTFFDNPLSQAARDYLDGRLVL